MEFKEPIREKQQCFGTWSNGKITMTVVVVMLSWSLTEAAAVLCPPTVPPFSSATPEENRVFLNLQNPIDCNGRVTAWKLCYHPQTSTDDGEMPPESYSVRLGVWREGLGGLFNNQDYYNRLDSLEVEVLPNDLPQTFSCYVYQLNPDEEFDVQHGDIVGFHTITSDGVLNVMASTGTDMNWYVAQRSTGSLCPLSHPASVSVDCFNEVDYLYGHTMHVYVMVEVEDGPTTSIANRAPMKTTSMETTTTTTTNRAPSKSTTVSIDTFENDQTTTMNSVPMRNGPSPTVAMTTYTMTYPDRDPTTESGQETEAISSANAPHLNGTNHTTVGIVPNQNEENSVATNSLVITTAVPIVVIILIIAMLILVVVIVIVMVNYRRKNKLLNFNRKRDERHQHIGLDHFVIVSDVAAIPAGSIVSSPVSMEPFPYEEALSPSLPMSIIENPHVNTSGALCNPIYGTDASGIYQSIVEVNEDASGKKTSSCAPYEVPIERVAQPTDVHSVPGPRVDRRRSSAKSNNAVNQTKPIPKLIMDPQGYSSLSEHYYKVLEEEISTDGSTGDKGEKFTEPATNVEELYAQVHKQKVNEIPDKDIKILELLGSGQFGQVSHGTLKNSKGETTDVALKTLVAHTKSIIRVKLLQEAAIMGQFFHPNVIKLLGVTTKKDVLMLVIEYATKSDLKKFLVSMLPDPGELLAPETDRLLLGFCHQVAFGMHYLSTKGFVHRDLAARNILVTQDCILKIADFGMSRDLADENYYISHGGKVPVKWTAPEAIHYLKYSTASDVWSYGCLLYEIWSLGQIPFNDCSNSEALDKLLTGYRLPPPPGCSRAIYSIMINCWHPEAQARPVFKELLLELLGHEKDLLKMTDSDSSTHSLANRVGGPLEAGEKMYTDLQWKYFSTDDEQQI